MTAQLSIIIPVVNLFEVFDCYFRSFSGSYVCQEEEKLFVSL